MDVEIKFNGKSPKWVGKERRRGLKSCVLRIKSRRLLLK